MKQALRGFWNTISAIHADFIFAFSVPLTRRTIKTAYQLLQAIMNSLRKVATASETNKGQNFLFLTMQKQSVY